MYDMAYMFSGATTFNKRHISWNVDNVSTMKECLKCHKI
nr:BspA family leucine-rich repeat surface protein [Mycoplasmopsis bovis]